jgi:hypothetical protein
MPLYMDMHNIDGGVAVKDVRQAHLADLQASTESDTCAIGWTRATARCSA